MIGEQHQAAAAVSLDHLEGPKDSGTHHERNALHGGMPQSQPRDRPNVVVLSIFSPTSAPWDHARQHALNRLERAEARVDMHADFSEKGHHDADVTLEGLGIAAAALC
jgi:hypothetical protein